MSGTVDDIVAQADPALVVVTTASRDEHAGCLVGFHAQCSIEPFRYAIWISKANHTYEVALFATHFAVHFLGDQDRGLAERFGAETGDSVDKFAGLDWSLSTSDVPVLAGCAAVVFRKETMWDDGGDHICLVGAPVTVASAAAFVPLRVSAVRDLEAGHDPRERPDAGEGESSAAGEAEELQEIAVGFGHELTPEQVDAFRADRESSPDE
jgi:flavin reductase (DIM6/NTAB) family NADH-FMN oxidoreductase RutF